MNNNILTKDEVELLIDSINDKQNNINNYNRHLELETNRVKYNIKHSEKMGTELPPRHIYSNDIIIRQNQDTWDKYQNIKNKIRNQYNIE
jgi:hypothetical protein